MEIITIESETFHRIIDKLDQVHQELIKLKDPKKELSKEWIDTYDVCHVLNVSRRTLTKYLTDGRLSYSKIDGKSLRHGNVLLKTFVNALEMNCASAKQLWSFPFQ